MSTTEQSINLPQLLVLTLLGFLAVRWYFSSRTPSATSQGTAGGRSGSSSSNGARQPDPAQVEQLLQMFPQLERRTIMWELARNGGSVQVATEKLLTGRALERPPQSYQPPMPAQIQRPMAPAQPKSQHPDLITRYNLAPRLREQQEEESGKGKQPMWSANKEERQSALQRRREEMILAARRRLEEEDRRAKEAGVVS